jgi:hypothetical protein
MFQALNFSDFLKEKEGRSRRWRRTRGRELGAFPCILEGTEGRSPRQTLQSGLPVAVFTPKEFRCLSMRCTLGYLQLERKAL